jgi:S-adenosyl-L-methionine hydrolase (adenosine-forming)
VSRQSGRRDVPPPIAILTDFGNRDHYVGVMKGVIASIAPGAQVIDLTHGVPPQSVSAGALMLKQSWRFFPPRTIFVAVVDPGVGTVRLPIAAETSAGTRFVGPDNGALWLAIEEAKLRVAVELRNTRYRMAEVSRTFHGRDVFAPAAAHLWRGVKIDDLGPRLREGLTRLELPAPRAGAREIRGEVIYVDSFGNLVTNIGRDALRGFEARFHAMRLSVRIDAGAPMEIHEVYGDVPQGAPLAIFGSFDLLEIAVRDGNAAERFAAAPGATVKIRPVGRNTHG